MCGLIYIICHRRTQNLTRSIKKMTISMNENIVTGVKLSCFLASKWELFWKKSTCMFILSFENGMQSVKICFWTLFFNEYLINSVAKTHGCTIDTACRWELCMSSILKESQHLHYHTIPIFPKIPNFNRTPPFDCFVVNINARLWYFLISSTLWTSGYDPRSFL